MSPGEAKGAAARGGEQEGCSRGGWASRRDARERGSWLPGQGAKQTERLAAPLPPAAAAPGEAKEAANKGLYL